MANATEPQRYIFKIILLGDYAVGKTCIIRRYVSDTFEEDYKASIGVDITSQQLTFGNKQVQLQIWDMSGQTDFRNVRLQFMNGTDCAFIVFDLTRPSSLENISFWIDEIHSVLPELPLVLVGNKSDLTAERQIDSDSAFDAKKKHKMIFYIETSAKSGDNISSVFTEISQLLLEELT